MTTGIYGIFDSQTDECLYVGQSKEIEVRFRQHITKLKNKRSNALEPFVEWYHDHGAVEEALTLRILESCENDRILKNQLEAKWFDTLSPKFFGKIPSLSESWDHTFETRLRIAESIRRSKGNLTGVSKSKPKSKNNKTTEPESIDHKRTKLSLDEKYLELDSEWKENIIAWYVSEDHSCREIARRMGMEDKVNVPLHLRRYGIDVIPRTFNGKKFSDEHLHKLSQSATIKASESAIYIDCKNCNAKVRTRPSRMRKFCSRNCYKNYDRVLQSSDNV